VHFTLRPNAFKNTIAIMKKGQVLGKGAESGVSL